MPLWLCSGLALLFLSAGLSLLRSRKSRPHAAKTILGLLLLLLFAGCVIYALATFFLLFSIA